MTKGQFIRLFLGSDNTAVPSKPIAAAKQLSLHISCTTEVSSTKDTEGDYDIVEITAINFDISTTALTRSGETISSSVAAQDFASIEDIHEAATPVKFQIANVSGDNNRVKGAVIMSGSVVLTQLTSNNQNRQDSTYSSQMQGYGEFSVGA